MVYGAWCRRVPFDNLVKRIHLVSGSADPFPNGPPDAFFAAWLRDGTGGTCWPSSGGLHALLVALGFDARRGSAAMYDNLSGPIHTHGTVIVRIDGVDYWVDSSMLTERPLPLVPSRRRHSTIRCSPVRAEPVDDLWRVWWPHPFLDEMIGCLLLDDDVTAEHYLARYELSRGMSPFNTDALRDAQHRRRPRHHRVRPTIRTRADGITSRQLARRRPRPGAGRGVRLLGGDRRPAPRPARSTAFRVPGTDEPIPSVVQLEW